MQKANKKAGLEPVFLFRCALPHPARITERKLNQDMAIKPITMTIAKF